MSLSEELRSQLGLDPDESIRVLGGGRSMLMLERACSAAPIAVPWDRDLTLAAEVRSFPLADILSMIHAAGKSGFLYFRHEENEKSIYLHRGEVVFAASNQITDRIGECLLRNGIITLEQLRDAERSFSPPGRFGRVLVQRGILAPRDLWNGLKCQVEEIVRSLFAHTTGTVHFWEGEVQPDNVVRLSLPTRRLISEGLAKRDELLRLLASLEDPRVRLRTVEESRRELAANERAILEALKHTETFGNVCQKVGLDPLSAARTLQLLSLRGVVRIERHAEVGSAGGGSDLTRSGDEAIRKSVMDHVKVAAELVAPLVAMDGAAAVSERLASVISETAASHDKLLGGLALGPGASLDPEELTQRALRLSGDRLRAVGIALGELISYLEFELRNHPRIDDPEDFLEAVSDLRAQLEY